MRKITTREFVAATSLALTLAAFGCTTNQYRGSGEPTMATPSYGATNQSVTPGSSHGTEGIPPMASSYSGVAQPNTYALAILAADQGFRGRVLGPANPGGVQAGVTDHATGQVMTPEGQQQTINPSIYSPGVEGVTGGVVGTATTAATSPAMKATVAKATTARSVATLARNISAVSGSIMVRTNSSGQIVVSNVADSSTHSH